MQDWCHEKGWNMEGRGRIFGANAQLRQLDVVKFNSRLEEDLQAV